MPFFSPKIITTLFCYSLLALSGWRSCWRLIIHVNILFACTSPWLHRAMLICFKQPTLFWLAYPPIDTIVVFTYCPNLSFHPAPNCLMVPLIAFDCEGSISFHFVVLQRMVKYFQMTNNWKIGVIFHLECNGINFHDIHTLCYEINEGKLFFSPFPHRAIRRGKAFLQQLWVNGVCVCVFTHAAFMGGLILEGSVICRAAAVLFILAWYAGWK